MPRPDELDHGSTKRSGAPDYDDQLGYYRNDPPLPRQTRVDAGARMWVFIFIALGVLVCAWLAAPSIVSTADASVNGCDQYRTEMVACAEASR
ncbi:hypothetical protein CP157_01110 [Paracoccus marcusii]|uniref:hypothetical protein n=1 Tax=Paracoccus marcusii TaxID=59779 RepID=UPI001C3E24DE|nr:hypothetical protein [Paracoccus marcusii]QXI63392.1 hypothetical protein CP157_01110 [Paracoccus marcusii]